MTYRTPFYVKDADVIGRVVEEDEAGPDLPETYEPAEPDLSQRLEDPVDAAAPASDGAQHEEAKRQRENESTMMMSGW